MYQNDEKKKPEKKVVIIGDIGVGKTSLIRRYIDCVFSLGAPQTIGAAFFTKQWNGRYIALWDTAGEEKFEGIRTFYSRNAHAVILCYSICQKDSFRSLLTKYSCLFENVAPNCVVALVGTKSDLIGTTHEETLYSREVERADVMKLYRRLKQQLRCLDHPNGYVPVFETSSRLDENVTEVFEHVFQTLIPTSTVESKYAEGSVELIGTTQSPKKTVKCCNTS